MSIVDLVGAILGFIFTLLVFSYIIGDNPLFRLAIHIFIGVAAGFATIMAVNNVLVPRLLIPLLDGSRAERILALVPMVLGWLLLTKISPRLSPLGNLPVAFLVGVGAAAAVGGAVTGTLFPQAYASINLFDLQSAGAIDTSLGLKLVNGVIILIGTIATLAYFHFGVSSRAQQPSQVQVWLEGLGQVGQAFIAITLGFIFAGIYSAAMVALIERLYFLVNFVKPLLLPLFPSS
ncbi:MAG: hypothetical protein A2Z45_03450 [Chloroflexi bacterium RBG_19FT_COMBO_55_16]|nr:MAG: hypothetical protein A2Z45_03450 [Chloroflexi bacterium RBG_19FT_COMBO_55_16]